MRARPVAVESPAQLRVLASPVRLEILEWVGAGADCGVAELARRMGRKPSSLYHHVHLLVRAGFLAERGRRRSGAREEVLYGLVDDRVEVAGALRSRHATQALARMSAALLRRAQREVRAALGRPGALEKRRGHALLASRMTARLTPAALERVTALVLELQAVFRAQRKSTEGRLFALSAVLAPLTDRSSSKAR
jgi:DNA-binding transcriptional ArsR family regulator